MVLKKVGMKECVTVVSLAEQTDAMTVVKRVAWKVVMKGRW